MATKRKPGASRRPAKKTGRPEIKLNYEQISRMASRLCTREEIADFLEVSKSRLDKDPLFRDAYKKGKAKGKLSLRRAQYRTAVGKGNPVMQIWLGKNTLGQKDTPDDTDKPRKAIRFVRAEE